MAINSMAANSAAMKSVVMSGGKLALQERPIPVPGPGQVLVKSRACGICGSDLHIVKHHREVLGLYRELGVLADSESDCDGDLLDQVEISLGHEFSAELVSYGEGTERQLAIGSRVTSIPILMSQAGAGVGVTPEVHGAYSEYFLLDEALLLPVPEGIADEAVAMTEPLAVGLHAVNRGAIQAAEVALVAGCGPIGLAAIVALKQQGIETIVASDPQAQRLAVARQLGATHTVNPVESDEVELATALADGQRLVIYECAGLQRLIPDFVRRAPAKSCIVFTGLHTRETGFNPALAMVKELDLHFAYYYQPEEFAEALQWWVEKAIDWRLLCTAKVGIDGVVDAFQALNSANDQIKVIVEPWRKGAMASL